MPPRPKRPALAVAQPETTDEATRRTSEVVVVVDKTAKRGRGRAAVRTADITASAAVPSGESSSSSEGRAALVKRRKLRKGTFSCIECKRRKVRCQFPSGSGNEDETGHGICVSCQRNGTQCVGQEYADLSPPARLSPDPSQQSKYNDVGTRIAQVEALVSELVRRRVAAGFPTTDSVLRPGYDGGGDDGHGGDGGDGAKEGDGTDGSVNDDTADLVNRELESVLHQDVHCFSHWMHDKFPSLQSPRFRSRSPSRSPLRSPLRLPSPALRQNNSPRRRSSSSSPLPLEMQHQLQQLERELIANRLLFPPKPSLGAGLLDHQALSRQLQAVLPTIDHALRIMSRGALFTLRRYRAFLLADDSLQKHRDAAALQAQAQTREGGRGGDGDAAGHPVLLARELIQLAVCLQMMDRDSNLAELGLPGAAPWETADRYFEVACRLVTSQDVMVASQAGLESLMLQAFFVVNKGDLRSGWATLRRALGIAQLMGLPPPSWAGQPPSLHYVWTRLLFSERFLSLMLGLPPRLVEERQYRSSLASPPPPHHAYLLARYLPAVAASWPASLAHLTQDLERLHALIIPRIAARNERLNQFAQPPPGAHWAAHLAAHQAALHAEYRDTRDIDYAFQQAAQMLPTRWWAVPDMVGRTMDWNEQIEETTRLMAQAKHYNFLVLLHLPYLTERRPGFLPAKPPRPDDAAARDAIVIDDYVPGRGDVDGSDMAGENAVNFREFGAPADGAAAAKQPPVGEDIAFAFGLHPAATSRPATATTTTATTTTTAPPDTTFSWLGALGAAREVLARFMVFRHCSNVIRRCYAFDFEAFVAAVAILLAHIGAHARRGGRGNAIHCQRPTDLQAVDEALRLIEALSRVTEEPDNGARAAILRRLAAVESDAAAGAAYDVWTEEGTLGRWDGRVAADGRSAVQTMSVPYFGTIHIRRVSSSASSAGRGEGGGEGESEEDRVGPVFWCAHERQPV